MLNKFPWVFDFLQNDWENSDFLFSFPFWLLFSLFKKLKKLLRLLLSFSKWKKPPHIAGGTLLCLPLCLKRGLPNTLWLCTSLSLSSPARSQLISLFVAQWRGSKKIRDWRKGRLGWAGLFLVFSLILRSKDGFVFQAWLNEIKWVLKGMRIEFFSFRRLLLLLIYQK